MSLAEPRGPAPALHPHHLGEAAAPEPQHDRPGREGAREVVALEGLDRPPELRQEEPRSVRLSDLQTEKGGGGCTIPRATS